jgi:positive regulator of sigma E activity
MRRMVFRDCRLLMRGADQASIVVGRPEGCASCAKGQGCGLSVFAKTSPEPVSFTLSVPDAAILPVAPCKMQIGISEQRLIYLSAIAYCSPVAAILIGAWLAPLLFGAQGNDWIGCLGAVTGLGLAMAFLKAFDHRLRERSGIEHLDGLMLRRP